MQRQIYIFNIIVNIKNTLTKLNNTYMTCIYTVEYVWIGGNQELRSKTRVLKKNIESINDIPSWNYDGSSTNQAFGSCSEVVIIPRALFRSHTNNTPLHLFNQNHIFVMCDTYNIDGTPHPTNTRVLANIIFNQKLETEPWYGIEQEYFIMSEKNSFDDSRIPLGYIGAKKQGQYYCSVGSDNAFGRVIAETHMRLCIDFGINISGINAEVAPGQWEYQIGPCIGIEAGDQIWMSRYLLQKISESFNYYICFEPKPLKGDWNGSGCHTNYSTKLMREGNSENNTKGIKYIKEAIKKLSKSHQRHMMVYGKNNNLRMTGIHETASYDKFSYGIGNRGVSVRIGNETVKNEKGYLEDRRPSSNCDPYIVTSIIFETTVLN